MRERLVAERSERLGIVQARDLVDLAARRIRLFGIHHVKGSDVLMLGRHHESAHPSLRVRSADLSVVRSSQVGLRGGAVKSRGCGESPKALTRACPSSEKGWTGGLAISWSRMSQR